MCCIHSLYRKTSIPPDTSLPARRSLAEWGFWAIQSSTLCRQRHRCQNEASRNSPSNTSTWIALLWPFSSSALACSYPCENTIDHATMQLVCPPEWRKRILHELRNIDVSRLPKILIIADSFSPERVRALLDRNTEASEGVLIAWPVRGALFLGPLLSRHSKVCSNCLLEWLAFTRRDPVRIGRLSQRTLQVLRRELRHFWKRPRAYANRIRLVVHSKKTARSYKIAVRQNCTLCDGANNLDPRSLINPVTGIVESISSASLSGIWVSSAEVLTRSPMHVVASGLGTSRREAELACLFESIERYSLCYQGAEQSIRASVKGLGDEVASHALLYAFSDAQYEERDDWNRRHSGMPYVPPKLPKQVEIDWSRCWSLDSTRIGWIPTQLAYLGESLGRSVVFYVSDSAGCAAGREPAQAMLNGLLELIERDAVAIWWYNRLARPNVVCKATDGRHSRWPGLLKSLGRDYCLFDITTDFNVPVFGGVSWEGAGRRPSLGFGCHPDPQTAMIRTIRELCQTSIGATREHFLSHPVGSAERAFLCWSQATHVFDFPHLSPSAAMREVQAREDLISSPADRLLGLVADSLRASEMEAWVLPVTRPELGIPAVRMVCGKLRHPGHRLAPGRLYEVPVRLGWLKQSLSEAEMNQTPCIF